MKVTKEILNEREYEIALKEAEKLIDLDPKPNTKEGNRLEFLAKIISDYEDIHYPIDTPTKESLIEFRKDQMNYNQ